MAARLVLVSVCVFVLPHELPRLRDVHTTHHIFASTHHHYACRFLGEFSRFGPYMGLWVRTDHQCGARVRDRVSGVSGADFERAHQHMHWVL